MYELEGFPIWWEDSPRVGFEAKSRIIRSKAVVDRAQKAAGDNMPPGTVFYAKPILRSGKFWPTREEWEAKRKDDESFDFEGGEAKVAAQSAGAEERAAAVAAESPEIQAIIKKFERREQRE